MEAVRSAIHAPSGLPVGSLYGANAESLKPRREDFADLEAIVFDVADVGRARLHVHWTMLLAMEACAGSAALRRLRPSRTRSAVPSRARCSRRASSTFVGLHSIPSGTE